MGDFNWKEPWKAPQQIIKPVYDKAKENPGQALAVAALSYYGIPAAINSWTGTVASPASSAPSMGLNSGALATPGMAAITAGTAGALIAGMPTMPPDPSMEAPPTIDEANDPNLAGQFQRMRAAARALGRAGTFKNKGAANLGGPSSLGSNLALQGT